MSAANWHRADRGFQRFATNVGTRYAGIVINALIGLVVLPLNIQYLGTSAYGLWMLTVSVTAYFSVLDFGYGGAIVRFVAEYRAKRDARALNEILSTMFFLYTGIGLVSYVVALVVAYFLPVIFNLQPGQAEVGRIILLIVAANVSLHFVFSIFGGVISGFQSYYLNNVIGTASNVTAAAVNVVVLLLGYGLVELVLATTVVRVAPYLLYRRNAHKVFPQLHISWAYFRRDRLRELTGFSIYLAVIDWANRVNYTIDNFTIGIFLNTAAVGVYSVGLRLSEALFRMTHQLHVFLFPMVVERNVEGNVQSQRLLMIRATRFQLAVAIAVCGAVAAVGDVLIPAWVGNGFEGSVPVLQILAFVVVLRAWQAMPGTLLKGTGHHKFVAAGASGCALANVLLSLALVKPLGIVGVALGTAIPVLILSSVVIFPVACRAVGLSTWRGYREIVWPTVWPAVVVIALLAATRHALPVRIIAVLAHLALGGLVYAVLFFALGLDRDERRWFIDKVSELWRGRPALATA